MTRLDTFNKRTFDIVLSVIGLLIFFPIIVISWIVASIDLRANGFFVQERIGKNGFTFKLYKIKSMKEIRGFSSCITESADPRITKFGKFFRDTKIDELPQLINVLKGDMSFVGPRPDVPGYADLLEGNDRLILSIRPGITGPAQIFFKKEEELLSSKSDPVRYNDKVIWPKKVLINKEYLEAYSFRKDLLYIKKTFF